MMWRLVKGRLLGCPIPIFLKLVMLIDVCNDVAYSGGQASKLLYPYIVTVSSRFKEIV